MNPSKVENWVISDEVLEEVLNFIGNNLVWSKVNPIMVRVQQDVRPFQEVPKEEKSIAEKVRENPPGNVASLIPKKLKKEIEDLSEKEEEGK